MKKKCLFPFILALLAVLSGCGQKTQDSASEILGTDENRAETVQEIQEEVIPGTEDNVAEASRAEGQSAARITSEDMAANDMASATEGQEQKADTPVVYMT